MTPNGSISGGPGPGFERESFRILGVRTPKLTVLDHFWGPNPVGPDWREAGNAWLRPSNPPDGTFGGVKTPPK